MSLNQNFTKLEKNIISLFPLKSTFTFCGQDYTVEKCGKPRPQKGECKTDVYILGKNNKSKEIELKISIKKENADFLENKISIDRAKEIFGNNAEDIIKNCTKGILSVFEKTPLIYFSKKGKTEEKSITLGWKFELLNKIGGEKSGEIMLTNEQKIDVYSGTNLSEEKRNARVNEDIIANSGIANYYLEIPQDANICQVDFFSQLQPIDRSFVETKKIYFACKALNFRVEAGKWDGDRPLAVYVKWSLTRNNQLNYELVYDKPLTKKGDEIGDNLKTILESLSITATNFNELEDKVSDKTKAIIYP